MPNAKLFLQLNVMSQKFSESLVADLAKGAAWEGHWSRRGVSV